MVAGVVAALPAGTGPAARLRVAAAAAGAVAPASPEADPEPLPAAVLGTGAGGGTVADAVAAPVAASARAPLPSVLSVLSAALGAADGPLHARASRAAHRFLERARHDGPVRAVAEQLRTGVAPPGFGHVVRPAVDPRAEELLDRLPAGPVADVVPGLLEQVVRAHGPAAFPNVDLGLAHALEEHRAPGLRFRVRGLHGA
ncbi:citrate/2-methylcitrate synthase [Kineococcus sp. SYSU DK002]|uniref:citrate/2-methylcitrate synthase n=1 Tax=Kineococcus sp. SYSU DK002 TaxID=3383123 RepID=UPI003D7DAC24